MMYRQSQNNVVAMLCICTAWPRHTYKCHNEKLEFLRDSALHYFSKLILQISKNIEGTNILEGFEVSLPY